jgi:hypothetical protein
MLYLRNTNQLQTLGQEIVRGTSAIPPEPPITSSYFSGLGLQQYFGNPQFISSSAQIPALTPSGSAFADSGSLQPTFTVNDQPNRSAQWLGYFLPSTTETYTFFTECDDGMFWWIGNEASASTPSTASAVLGFGGTPLGGNRLTGSISLISGSYYPVRLQYFAVDFPNFFTASFSTPTITKTTNFTGYTFCNTASLGF